MSFEQDYNKELYHYGVLGMKWGKRKADRYAAKSREYRRYAEDYNPDNYTVKLSDKERRKLQSKMNKNNAIADKYASKSTYTYKSHSTKKYERKATNAKNQADADKYANRAKRSKELDRREQSIAEKTSTGKVFATRLLTGGVGAKNYQQYQAMGDSKVAAAAKSYVDVMFLGGIGSRVKKAKYIRQDEKK